MKFQKARVLSLANALAWLALVSASCVLVLSRPLSDILQVPMRNFVILGILGMASSSIYYIYRYLTGSLNFDWISKGFIAPSVTVTQNGGSPAYGEFAQAVTDALRAMERRIEEVRDIQVQAIAGDRDQLLASLRPTLVEDVSKNIEARLSEAAIDAERLRLVRKSLSERGRQLNLELVELGRRSALNLAFGSIVTLLAAGFLAYTAMVQAGTFATIQALLSYYIPRLSVVVFIEVFAFFFLRLYRTTLHEIRLCQRELTDLVLNYCALETGWASTDVACKGALSEALLKRGENRGGTAPSDTKVDIDPKVVAELLVQFAKVINSGKS